MIKFDDALLKKAYSDYMYTRDMMECDKDAGAEDLASVSMRYLRQHGKLDKIGDNVSGDSAAIKINVNINGENEPWILTVRNRAIKVPEGESSKDASSACLEGCIKDATLARSRAYAAVKLAGASDPLESTLGLEPEGGKISARRLAQDSVDAYTSYAGRLGISTASADEFYHEMFKDGRLEASAVLSAMPAVDMRREDFRDDDLIFLLADKDADEGDGPNPAASVSYYRKLQRLLTNSEAAGMIKQCLESEEGMALRVGSEHEEMFRGLAEADGIACRPYDYETEQGAAEYAPAADEEDAITEISEAGAEEVTSKALSDEADSEREIVLTTPGEWQRSSFADHADGFSDGMRKIAEDINTCSRRGLVERFDSTYGGRTVLMPLGGVNQLSPAQAMAHKVPAKTGTTDDCSMMSYGFNPHIYDKSPYHGAYLAVVESIARLIASGASFNEVYLSVMTRRSDGNEDAGREGRTLSALLGAFEAEMGLSVPAVSVFECSGADAFISYAVTMGKSSEICSSEFKEAGHGVVILSPEIEKDSSSVYCGLPTPASLISVWRKAYELLASGRAISARTPGMGGIADSVMKMCYGGGVGFEFTLDAWGDGDGEGITPPDNIKNIFDYAYGSIILELASDEPLKSRSVNIRELGRTTGEPLIRCGEESVDIGDIIMLYEGKLESVYPSNADGVISDVSNVNYAARSWHAPIFKRSLPKVLIPTLPGATSEEDALRAVRAAGGHAEILRLPAGSADSMLRSAAVFAEAVKNAQIIFLPDGFTAPGSEAAGENDHEAAPAFAPELAELTSYIFRNEEVRDRITEFLDRKDGLIAGIGAGFKALLDLGLLPNGSIGDEDGPTLELNSLGAYQSRIVRVRVASNKSPWLRSCKAGEIYSLPVSGSEGRFTADAAVLKKLIINGQIVTQYADNEGNASSDIRFNPCGSVMAVEGISSPDGRVLGRMGHVERTGEGLYRNVPGRYLTNMFENAIRYFK